MPPGYPNETRNERNRAVSAWIETWLKVKAHQPGLSPHPSQRRRRLSKANSPVTMPDISPDVDRNRDRLSNAPPQPPRQGKSLMAMATDGGPQSDSINMSNPAVA